MKTGLNKGEHCSTFVYMKEGEPENLGGEIKVRVDDNMKIGFKKIATRYTKASDHQRLAFLEYLQRQHVLDHRGNLIEAAQDGKPVAANPPPVNVPARCNTKASDGNR